MTQPQTPPESHPQEREPMEEQPVGPVSNEINPEVVVPIGQPSNWRRPGGEGGKYRCETCGKTFNSKAELNMHIESQHKGVKEKRSRNRQNKEANQQMQL
jgi:DNA-directed RNA polymerase subunit RPC12/RpoP